MQVLCNIQDSFLLGVVPVFEAAEGLKLTVFDDSIPVYDIFDEVQPDVFLTKNTLLNRALLKYLEQDKDIKVCIVQTKTKNFYSKEMEKSGRINYLLEDEPAADLMTFKDCELSDKVDASNSFDLVVTDFLSGNAFIEVTNRLYKPHYNFCYRIVGNKLVQHPSYIGQVDYKEIPYLLKQARYGVCEINTDWQLSLIYNDKDDYVYEDGHRKDAPTKEQIVTERNYNRKLYNIFNGLGYTEEANQCLQSLVLP